jgi:hypothetical protein
VYCTVLAKPILFFLGQLGIGSRRLPALPVWQQGGCEVRLNDTSLWKASCQGGRMETRWSCVELVTAVRKKEVKAKPT